MYVQKCYTRAACSLDISGRNVRSIRSKATTVSSADAINFSDFSACRTAFGAAKTLLVAVATALPQSPRFPTILKTDACETRPQSN